MKLNRFTIAAAALVLSAATFAGAQATAEKPVVQSLKEAQWGAAPPVLPAGAEIAVLTGNPMAAGPYALRIKFPAHYVIPAHSHPTTENVVVASGAVTFGMGDKLNKTAAANKTLAGGGFASMPPGMNHYAFTGATEATIVLFGQGPVEFKYVDPKDDPRNAK
jgi:quercetin dioxygenase-like cupin family protein